MASNLETLAKESNERLLSPAIREYNSNPHTPELVRKTWQTIWQVWGRRVGLDITASALALTQEEIEKHEQEVDPVFWVPTKVTLPILGKIFPNMRSYSMQEGSPVTVENGHINWRSGEASIKAPNSNTTERELEDLFTKQGREGMDLREYIILSQWSKLTTGRHLDEGATWSRLPGSRDGGQVVDAGFDQDGYLYVRWYLRAGDPYPDLGGRSSAEVKRT